MQRRTRRGSPLDESSSLPVITAQQQQPRSATTPSRRKRFQRRSSLDSSLPALRMEPPPSRRRVRHASLDSAAKIARAVGRPFNKSHLQADRPLAGVLGQAKIQTLPELPQRDEQAKPQEPAGRHQGSGEHEQPKRPTSAPKKPASKGRLERLRLSEPAIAVPQKGRAMGSLSEYQEANGLSGDGGNISAVDYTRGQVLGWMEKSSLLEHKQAGPAEADDNTSRTDAPSSLDVSRVGGMGSLIGYLGEGGMTGSNAPASLRLPEHACGSVFGWLSRCSHSSGENHHLPSYPAQICVS
eukprot:TRINITY_DN14439_c0_g1_i1.p1 TRINITY_DN14439_c0_g1~~TRINITY_DN14439_c0_g1_i1.p1  ORF type:complete len:297 (-),score=25.97 TRINITY_DN14439_c0_g1_i1:250-1140(-)